MATKQKGADIELKGGSEAQRKALKELVAEKGPYKVDVIFPNGDILVTMKTKAQFFITYAGKVFKEAPKEKRVHAVPGSLFSRYAEQMDAERGAARPMPGQRQLFKEV